MARKLKTFQTSLGFYDLAIAAPSMKAALGAWGADSNLFHQGAAKESEDPDVIAATMEKPGVVLKRPVGSSGAFRENAQLPIDLAGERRAVKANRKSSNHRAQKRAADPAADRNAALAFEREEKRRARERTKEEAFQRKERERRQNAIEKAQGAFNAARQKHEDVRADIQAELDAVEKRSQAEDSRWEKESTRLEAMLRRAQE